MDKFDKYASLSNGICSQLPRQPWNCEYLDGMYRYKPLTVVKYTSSFPGERAISLFQRSNEEYTVAEVMCIFPYRRVQSDYKYHFLTRNVSTVYLTFRNKVRKTPCFLIILTNTDIPELSLSLFKVQLNDGCPIGFFLSPEGVCGCSGLRSRGYTCNIDTRIFSSPPGYWTGYGLDINPSFAKILFARNCPPNYCDPDFTLNNSITDLSCLNNRTGILCGQCKENYSAVFGSDVCYDNCTDLYLFTLPMYAIAGLILVVLLFALRLTVATGTINGIIFYANVLGLLMDELTRGYSGTYLAFFRIVVSLLNLNLGFPLCFYKGMTTTARVGFQFIFPVYLWSIIIGMIIISKYSIRVFCLISKSSVQVLATLFYLSFSKLLQTVIDVVVHSTLDLVISDPSNLSLYTSSERIVWPFSGEDYGHDIHALYLALAVAFIVLFLLPYAILVTFSYCLVRFKLVNKFKPIIDAYGGPFKDKLKFWFGLHLWITIILFIISGALQGTNTNTLLIFTLVILHLFILFQALLHPF